MDFDILYAIQSIRFPFLDQVILGMTKVMGEYGQIWLALGAVLLIFRKTRKTGIAILLSYALTYVVGQFILKDWIARPRPCHLDQTIELLVKAPSSYSCPSTHTAWAFGAAVSVLCSQKRWGIGVLAVAVLIGFSRMYLFVHFPTDVLLGAVLGTIMALLSVWIVHLCETKLTEKKKGC